KLNFFKTVDGKEKYLLDPALIEENGLPMICLASEMMVRYKDGEALQSAAGGITIAPSTNAEIHADLSFLCAKVRYTLLFDNSSFSKEIFENRSWNLTGVTASNLYNEPYSLDGTVNGNAVAKGLKNLPEDERAYPTNANINDYPTEEQAFVDLDDPASDAFPKRCFQGVFYFPGNDGSKALTSLSFEALEQHKDKDNNVKDGAKLTYKMDLLPKKVDDSKAIVNSHAYDVVAKVTGLQDIEAEVKAVQAWTPRSLVYSLMPPTYLKVDKTVVDMVAGDETEIEYETNAANISIESPKYTVNGTPQPLYELIKTADGKMYVTVSSKVPVSAYSGINSAIAANNYNKQYHYFYIIAGNIRKKIDIENLTLQRFLTVDPINITIDAREKIASGEYAGDIEVTIRTNLDKIYLNTGEKDENNNDVRQWGTITNGKSNCLSLTNTSNNGKLWENGNNQEYIVTSDIQDGVLKLKIHFDRINTNGETFWSSSKVLTFVVSCDNTGNPGDPDYLFPEKVNVNLLPNNDNYTIYFNAPSGWTDPHIYIYQCLELPMYLGEREINTGAKPDLSSYPVGYQIKDNDGNVVAANAALEYLFSGGVAFKGWDADENKSALSELNKGWIERGFYMFKDGTQESCSWNPADSKSDNRYYKDLDFNTEHRKLTICSSCGTIRNGYPGIGMYKVKADDSDPNTDWWKFELSGIATPGKALIMFADGHNGDDNKRFPGKNINGIPLFDHPNRIGYLNLADGYETFSQTPSGVNETESITTIYFTNPNNWTNVYVYMWGDSGANGAWKATKMTKINNNLWSYDIPTDKTYTQVIFYDGTTDNVGDHKTNNLAI
ncbi:MAG: starch-binding protein, partial [Muribaculaceae bacterium]|nr:starch-binding protein [Muribaculaceae bacterium]